MNMAIQTDKGDIKPIIYLGAISDKGLLIVKYKVAPNPLKTGWWLPAPEINYGGDPSEEMANLVRQLGLKSNRQTFVGVDSFIANKAWHLAFKYRVEVTGDVSHENIVESRWVTADSLPGAEDFAHGNWEIELCRFFLSESRERTAV
jgi:hypothetical protein